MTADVTTILTATEITALRASYAADPEALRRASAGALTGPYPASGDYINAVLDGLYDPAKMPPGERERCLVAVLADHAKGAGVPLAVHLYWGLMVGLSPEDLARTLLLAGVYTGVPNLAFGLSVAATTFGVLKSAVAQGGEAMEPMRLLGALQRAFTPAPSLPKS